MRTKGMSIAWVYSTARVFAVVFCIGSIAVSAAAAESDPIEETLRDAFIATQLGRNGKALGLYMLALTQVSVDEASFYRIPTVVGEMLTLAQTYPAARIYLEERRDRLELQVVGQAPENATIWEWVALSEGLDGNTARILRVYDNVRDRPQGQQIAFFVWQDLARAERFTEIESVLLERSQQWLTETGALVIELKKQGPDHGAYVELAPLFVEAGELLLKGLDAVSRDQEFREVRALMAELNELAVE
jgi:hypothetical protein